MQGTINRQETSIKAGTFGTFLIDGEMFCSTLERPFLGNKINISSVPPGQYLCKKIKSNSYGITFELIDVDERTFIYFHWGNIKINSKGCILIGEYTERVYKQRGLKNSRKTFNLFMSKLKNIDSFKLTIREIY